jgi:hypothetical protein
MEEKFNLNEHLEDKLRERLAKKHGVNKEQIILGFKIEIL